MGFPCVIKAVSLSASQGVLRAGDAAPAVTAAPRIRPRPVRRTPAGRRAAAGRGVPARPGAEHRRPARRRRPDRHWPSSTSPPRRTAPRSRKPCSSPPPGCPAPVLAAAVGTAGQRRPRARPAHRPGPRRTARRDRGGQPGPPCSNWRHAPSAACAHARCGSPAARAWKSSILASALGAARSPRPARHRPGRPGCSCSLCRAPGCSARSRAAPTLQPYPGSPA